MVTLDGKTRRSAPLYQVMKRELEKAIYRGDFSAGCRVPSESELIATYQVSSTTARRCLDELEHEGLLYRVRGKGTFVSDIASLLQREQVAVLVRDLFNLSHPFIAQVLAAMDRITESSSLHLSVQRIPLGENPAMVGRALVSTMRHHKVEYALVLSNVALESISALVDAGVNCLGVNTRYQDERIPYVALDFEGKSMMALEALARVGHREIVFLVQEPSMRESGVLNSSAYIASNWVKARFRWPDLPEEPKVIEVGYRDDSTLERHVEAVMRQARPPTAFVVWDELAGLETVRQLRRLGYRVPQEVSVIGSRLLPSSELAVTDSSFVEMATEAAQSMLEWVTTRTPPRSRLFGGAEFLPRETFAAPPCTG